MQGVVRMYDPLSGEGVVVNGAPKRLHVCTSCLKAGKVQKP